MSRIAHADDLVDFFNQQNRLPRLGDERPPWKHRGWLLPYVIMLHQHCPAVGDCWGFLLRTQEPIS